MIERMLGMGCDFNLDQMGSFLVFNYIFRILMFLFKQNKQFRGIVKRILVLVKNIIDGLIDINFFRLRKNSKDGFIGCNYLIESYE